MNIDKLYDVRQFEDWKSLVDFDQAVNAVVDLIDDQITNVVNELGSYLNQDTIEACYSIGQEFFKMESILFDVFERYQPDQTFNRSVFDELYKEIGDLSQFILGDAAWVSLVPNLENLQVILYILYKFYTY